MVLLTSGCQTKKSPRYLDANGQEVIFANEADGIKYLIDHINEKPDWLHFNNTAAVNDLINIGEPALKHLLPLMLLGDEPKVVDGVIRYTVENATCMRAGAAFDGIVMKMFGFAAGHGWPEGGDKSKEVDLLWEQMGDYNSESSLEKRKRSVALWQEWIDKRASEKPKNNH